VCHEVPSKFVVTRGAGMLGSDQTFGNLVAGWTKVLKGSTLHMVLILQWEPLVNEFGDSLAAACFKAS